VCSGARKHAALPLLWMATVRRAEKQKYKSETRKYTMKKSVELREKRAALAAQAQELLGNMNAENATKFDAMMADVEVMKGTIDRCERAEALELELRSSVRPPLAAANADVTRGTEAEVRAAAHKSAFSKFVRNGDASEIRTYTPMSDSVQGAFIVPQGFQYELEQALLAYGGVRQVARLLPTATGNALPWPTSNDTAVSGELIGENTASTQANPTISNLTLNAWKYGTKLVQVSTELMQDSAFDVEAYLRELFTVRIGRITNNHFTVGTGSGQPNGIVTAASAGPTAEAAGSVSYNDLVELEHSVDPAYRRDAKFMFKDSTLKSLKKLKDSQGHPLWVAGVGANAPDTILGYGYVINQDMAAIGTGNKQMLFGALNKYIIRSVKELSVLRLNERYAELGQVGFIGFARYDSNLVDAGTHPVKILIGA